MTCLFVGLSTLDIQYFTDTFPQSNVKVKTDEPMLLVGGPATNASIAYSFLGGKSILASGVGKNHFNTLFAKDFEVNSISHVDLYGTKNQLPVIASVITSTRNGDRNIFTYNPNCDIEIDVASIFEKYKPELLMVDGFYPDAAEQSCIEAKRRNIPVVFDGGSWKPHLSKLLKCVDYAICSSDFHPPGCDQSPSVFNYLKDVGVQYPVITQGEQPILCFENQKICEVPVKSINPVDTLGAGDFFHGAFCYYISQKISFKAALEKASLLASKTCKYRGTREWLLNEERNTFL